MGFLIRFLLKVIVLPFVIALTVVVPFMYFIFCLFDWVLTSASVLVASIGIIMLVTGYSVYSSVGLIVMGFLVSPFGIPSIIEWFIDKLFDLNCSLKNFITG